MSVCKKHQKNPAWGYSPCPGCEVERLRDELAEQCRLLGAGSEREARLMAERDELARECARLRATLEDAAECVEEWGGYASAYFQEKHDLAGDVRRFREAARLPAGIKLEGRGNDERNG